MFFILDFLMAISTQEIRERAVAAHAAGQTLTQIAACYGVHWKTVQKWWRRFRETGNVEAQERGHRACTLNVAEMQQLANLVQKRCDATLEELRDALKKPCSLTTIHNALERLGYDVKKNTKGQRTRSPRH